MPPKGNKKEGKKNKKGNAKKLMEELQKQRIDSKTLADNVQAFGEKFIPQDPQDGSKSMLTSPPQQERLPTRFKTDVVNVIMAQDNTITIKFR